jgi:hypothetical protein
MKVPFAVIRIKLKKEKYCTKQIKVGKEDEKKNEEL